MTWEGERGGFFRPSLPLAALSFFLIDSQKKLAQKMIFLN